MKLNDKSFTPLYQQVLEDLKANIGLGHYKPGDKIPSEAELSEIYSVSRVTVRRAIEELVGEGYLTSRQGKGTFVNPRKMTRKLTQSSGVGTFVDLCADAGMTPSASLIERLEVPAQDEDHALFGPDCKELIYVARILSADDVPIMIVNNYFPSPEFSFLLEDELKETSLFDTVYNVTGRKLGGYGTSTIEIALASAKLAEMLELSVGAPLFYERVHFLDTEGKVLCLSHKYIAGSRYMFEH